MRKAAINENQHNRSETAVHSDIKLNKFTKIESDQSEAMPLAGGGITQENRNISTKIKRVIGLLNISKTSETLKNEKR